MMPEQDAEERSRNFQEVNLGLDEEQAIREAKRCLNCKNRQCVAGMPGAGFDPRVRLRPGCGRSAGRRPDPAGRQRPAGRLRPGLPAGDPVRGRSASAGVKGAPVAIGYLERFVADWAMAHAAELRRGTAATGDGQERWRWSAPARPV